MKADLRRQIADRAAELAVDRFQEFTRHLSYMCISCDRPAPIGEVFPEELLALQHDIEDELYRELERA